MGGQMSDEQKFQDVEKSTNFSCGSTVLDSKGKVVKRHGSPQDITERKQTEEAAQNSESFLKSLLDAIPIPVFYKDFEGRYLDFNKSFEQFYGKSKEDLLGKTVFEINPPDLAETYFAKDQEILETGEPQQYEAQVQNVSGNRREVIFNKDVFRDNQGNIRGLIGTIQDITERKHAEDILHKRNEMLKLTEAMAHIGSWEWDVHHDRVYWSEELFRIFGRDPSKGAPSFAEQSEFYADGDIQRLRDAVDTCVNRGTPYEIELRALRPGGGIRHCISRGKPQYDENGKVVRLVGSFQDITHRKHSEKQIESLERRNQALLDHSPVCHKIVDLDFNLQYMSANGFKMLGLDQNAQVYGKPYPFEFFPESFKLRMIKHLKHVRKTGETVTMEALTNDIEGKEVWLDSSLIPVFDDDDKIDYITVVSANTTQRKLDEKERNRLEERLKQSQKMEAIGTIAGGVAHDFNNILFPIIGMSELLIEDLSKDSPEYENAMEILTAGKRGADLVNQILAFSRQTEHKMAPTRIQTVLKEVLKLTRSTIPSYIEINQNIKNDCGMVMADPTQIHRIAMNIITNAYHAIDTDDGKISVVLRETEIELSDLPGKNIEPGKYALLSFSDTGHGIPPAYRDKIFDPYFTIKEQGKGTGLGLAVVYGIVKQHKGDIAVYSEVGKGTTFNIYLPLIHQTSLTDVEKSAEKLPTGNENILLIDDEEPIARLGKLILERLGYRVSKQTNPIEALILFKENPDSFDLIISDMNMPNMTGFQLAKEIKYIRNDIPFIICTGFSDKIDEKKADVSGIESILMKPVIKSEMAQTVRSVLDDAKVSL
nr:PAS domain-containing protein [uncultured Desulfobacter sp.]